VSRYARLEAEEFSNSTPRTRKGPVNDNLAGAVLPNQTRQGLYRVGLDELSTRKKNSSQHRHNSVWPVRRKTTKGPAREPSLPARGDMGAFGVEHVDHTYELQRWTFHDFIRFTY